MKKIISLVMMVLVLVTSTVNATINVDVHPSRVTLGESFQFVLTVDSLNINSAPNLMGLQTDFHIEGTEHRLSYTMIQGDVQAISQWIITLHPRRAGRLTIPSIPIAQEHSEATSVMVINPSNTAPLASTSSTAPSSDAVIKLEAEVDQHTPRVYQQVLYTVKLYSRARLMQADYLAPHADDVMIMPLGQVHRSQVEKDGDLWAVEEQQYALFPQKAGKITIQPPQLHALVYRDVPRHEEARANKVALNVQPALLVGDKKTPWLPAEQLQITQTLTPKTHAFKSGDTLVRVVTIKATGIPPEFLPKLHPHSTDDLRVYVDQPKLSHHIRQGRLVSQSVMTITYLFNAKGQVIVPAIDVPWYNTKTKKEEHARIDGLTVLVKSQKPPAAAKKSGHSVPLMVKSSIESAQKGTQVWVWMSLFFALLWVLTLLLWWLLNHQATAVRERLARRRRSRQHTLDAPDVPRILAPLWSPQRRALRRLKKACLRHDPMRAKEALLAWAKPQWPKNPPRHLHELMALVHDNALHDDLEQLSRVLYAQKESRWDARTLWQHVVNYRPLKKDRKDTQDTFLPPMR